ncbi:MAG: hypothetical protein R6U96_00120 [Promethearchaeia archaeon]
MRSEFKNRVRYLVSFPEGDSALAYAKVDHGLDLERQFLGTEGMG